MNALILAAMLTTAPAQCPGGRCGVPQGYAVQQTHFSVSTYQPVYSYGYAAPAPVYGYAVPVYGYAAPAPCYGGQCFSAPAYNFTHTHTHVFRGGFRGGCAGGRCGR